MTARDDLAQIVRDATIEYFREDLPEDGRDETDTIVDALIAAGYSRPRIVSTVEELEALESDSVVMEAPDQFGNRGAVYEAADPMGWEHKWMWGDEQTSPSGALRLPVTVLFEPTEKETR